MLPSRRKIAWQRENTMNQLVTTPTVAVSPVSPLMLSDRLITLARDADRAGFTGTADRLVKLAYAIFDEPARPPH